MEATFINVGYGDSILLRNENDYISLFDGGSDLKEEFSDSPYRIRAADYLKSQGVHRLKSIFISHIHEDHVCGLMKVLQAVEVETIYIPYPKELFETAAAMQALPEAARSVHLYTQALNLFGDILRYAKTHGIAVETLRKGDTVTLSDNIAVEILAPGEKELAPYLERLGKLYESSTTPEEATRLLTQLDASSNQTSMLMRISQGKNVMLLSADSCPNVWGDVPIRLLKNVNVLKLPHHGQKDCISEQIMREMPLEYVITTSASDRRYNSANEEVYRRLSEWFEPRRLTFLFTDERSYPPYFSQPGGFRAINLVMDSEHIKTEFVK